jgi:hypothetical protein
MYVETLNGLRSAQAQALLLEHDENVAKRVQAQRCAVIDEASGKACGGTLHNAPFPRKPRGGAGLDEHVCERLSFCCAIRDCRKRVTPPSLRFLGRKLYLAVVVVIIAALRCGETPERLNRLRELVDVSPQTVKRWLQWWREVLPATDLWAARRSRLRTQPKLAELPQSLLEQFAGPCRDQVLWLLRFIAPLTGGRRPGVAL